MYCSNCCKQIDGNAVVCPHCGKPTNKKSVYYGGQRRNAIAVTGYIFSFLFAIAGLVCSIIGYKNSVIFGAPNKELAQAGIIISIISIILKAIFLCVLFAPVSAT